MAEPQPVERSRPEDGHDAELFAALAHELADGVQGLYLLARSVAQGLDGGLPCAVASLAHGDAPDALYQEAERRSRRIPPADRPLVVEQALDRARVEAAELLGSLAEALAVVRCEATVGGAPSSTSSLVHALHQIAAAQPRPAAGATPSSS
jgi:hypothetical protein